MTPGQLAVAALGDGEEGLVLIVIDEAGEVLSLTGVEAREARQMIDLAVERLAGDLLVGERPTALRRIQGGAWAFRMRCPDGQIRLFVEKRGSIGKPRTSRVAIPLPLRWDVLMRDGFRCRYCGRMAPEVRLVVDHVLPVVDGGANDLDNLATACVDCNTGKGRRRLVAGDRVSDRVPGTENVA